MTDIDDVTHDHMTIGPWFRRNPTTTLAVAIALFLAIFAGRFLVGEPEDAIGLLYTLPVSLLAFAFGRRGGVAAAAVAIAMLVAWAVIDDTSFSTIGWASRMVPLALIGILVGDAATRDHEAEETRQELAAVRLKDREAAEINDSIVQGLAAAKWSLETGNTDSALRLLGETMNAAQEHVSRLLGTRDGGSVDLRLRVARRA